MRLFWHAPGARGLTLPPAAGLPMAGGGVLRFVQALVQAFVRALVSPRARGLMLALGLALACAANAQTQAQAQAVASDDVPVPALSARVIDRTGTLTPAQRDALQTQLAAVEQQRGTQLVVLMVPSTLPEDIAAYAHRVADTWKLGRRDVGDGLLIVVAKNDRKMRIEVAKTLEGAIPDLIAKRIIVEHMAPAFRQGDYAGGLREAIARLDQRIAGEHLPEPTAQRPRGTGGIDSSSITIFFLAAVPILGAILSAMFGRKLGALVTGGAVGGIAWLVTTSVFAALGAAVVALIVVAIGLGNWLSLLGSGGWGGGSGGGWSGGGGFSSGGGGDFGGGGASGDW